MESIDWLDERTAPILLGMTRRSSRTLARRIEARIFEASLAALAALARSRMHRLAQPVLRRLARLARVQRGSPTTPLDAAALAREWQRLMPNPKVVPITRVDEDTAYAEIRSACPLRGTGDVAACHRLMEYDRALLAPMGGRFVVLRSQAEPGVTHCEVALRPAHRAMDDLLEAHVRVERLTAVREAGEPLSRGASPAAP